MSTRKGGPPTPTYSTLNMRLKMRIHISEFMTDNIDIETAIEIIATNEKHIKPPIKIRDHGGGDFRREAKAAFFACDKFTCVYCGAKWEHEDITDLGADQEGNYQLNIDHIIPRYIVALLEEAGLVDADFLNSKSNLATCCSSCNIAKGTKSAFEFADSKATKDRLSAIIKNGRVRNKRFSNVRRLLNIFSYLVTAKETDTTPIVINGGQDKTRQRTIAFRVIASQLSQRFDSHGNIKGIDAIELKRIKKLQSEARSINKKAKSENTDKFKMTVEQAIKEMFPVMSSSMLKVDERG